MNVRFARVIVFLVAMASPALATAAELPGDGLENRIDFWKKVYTQYGADDVIIHDRFYVNLIYDVVGESDVSSRISDVRDALSEISLNLDNPAALSPMALEIYDGLVQNKVPLTPSMMGTLTGSVHTQRGIKERFRQGIIRSGRFIDSFQNVFVNAGIPKEVALLPLVESSFENRSLSKAGAAGIWQFTRGTGRLYLKVQNRIDERLDPVKATRAAARLLRDNYDALGSWPLAITAYNHGRGGMLRAKSAHGSDLPTIIEEYDGELFGYASMNFYSEFLAAVQVYKTYPLYFGELALDEPTTTAPSPRGAVRVQTAASDKYKVRSGDTLWQIAQRFGTSIRDLMEMNNLKKTSIHAGQILLVK